MAGKAKKMMEQQMKHAEDAISQIEDEDQRAHATSLLKKAMKGEISADQIIKELNGYKSRRN